MSNITFAQICRPGGRNYNQDQLDIAQHPDASHLSCYVLCDGFSSYKGGKEAAQLAAETAATHFKDLATPDITKNILKTCIAKAQEAIVFAQKQHLEFHNMRTTIIMVLIDSKAQRAIYGHIGDSRAYIFRQGRYQNRSKDHTEAQIEIDSLRMNEFEARKDPLRTGVYKSLGKKVDEGIASLLKDRDIIEINWQAGDSILLCSDGIWEYVFDEELEIDLCKSKTPSQWLKHIEDRRWQAVYKQQKHQSDNYSAIAIFMEA